MPGPDYLVKTVLKNSGDSHKQIVRRRKPVTVMEDKSKGCACSGRCSGYGTKNNCPPLIVIAVALMQKEAA